MLKKFIPKFFKIATPIIAVVAIVVAGILYYQLRKATQNPQLAAQNATTQLVEKVSKLIVLPTGEVPTIATVADPSALKSQPFFNGAQKGDKVLIYQQAKEAVLYSVSLNKVVNVAPLNIGSQGAPANTTAQTAPTVATPASTPTPVTKTVKK